MPFSAGGLLNDTKLTLEKTASDKFGSAVEDFTKNKLGNLIPGGSAGSTRPANRNDGSWYATSYAASLAGWDYRPKLKFLFKVEFIFAQWAIDKYRQAFDNLQRNSFTFMVKQVDRPKIAFEYEEDVNMYNFRTKVLKKIRHQDLTMIFMDDTGNRVFDFVRTLMMIHQPITERGATRDNSMRPPDPSSKTLPQGSGMVFSDHDKRALVDAAHRGVVNSQYGNSIECIRVKQIFVSPAATIDNMSQMTTFDFISPRIVTFDFDELSHESNDVSQLTMTFDYDWMEMVKVGALGTGGNQYEPDYKITVPGVNGAPSDITPNHVGTATGPRSAAGGGGNILSNALGGVLGRGASQLTSDAIGRLVKTVGGNGRFATTLGGFASAAGSSLSSSLSGPVGGIVQGGVRDLLSSGGLSSPNSTNARASSRIITDKLTAGSDRALAVQSSSPDYLASSPAVSDFNGVV